MLAGWHGLDAAKPGYDVHEAIDHDQSSPLITGSWFLWGAGLAEQQGWTIAERPRPTLCIRNATVLCCSYQHVRTGACFILGLENPLADYQELEVKAFCWYFCLHPLLDVGTKLVFQSASTGWQERRRSHKITGSVSLCKQHVDAACFCSITSYSICQAGFYVPATSWICFSFFLSLPQAFASKLNKTFRFFAEWIKHPLFMSLKTCSQFCDSESQNAKLCMCLMSVCKAYHLLKALSSSVLRLSGSLLFTLFSDCLKKISLLFLIKLPAD